MFLDRRSVLAGLGVATTSVAATAGPRAANENGMEPSGADGFAYPQLEPGAGGDQTDALQAAIDAGASRGAPVLLPPGHYRIGRIALRPGTRLIGAYGKTILEFAGGPAFITARDADGTAALTLSPGRYSPISGCSGSWPDTW